MTSTNQLTYINTMTLTTVNSPIESTPYPGSTITLQALCQYQSLGKHSALSSEDHKASIVLAILQLDLEGVAILTDGLFGLTRTGSSTCDIIGIHFASNPVRNRALSMLQSAVRYGKYPDQPDQLSPSSARSSERQSTRQLRSEINAFRNRDRTESASLINQAHSEGAITKLQRDQLLARLPKDLPPVTAGRDLFKLMSYWGFISSPINGPCPVHAQQDHKPSIPSTDDLMAYIKSDATNKYIPDQVESIT